MRYVLGWVVAMIWSINAMAIEWQLGQHITVSPADDMDVTFQVFEEYDPEAEVLLGWNGDILEYMMTVDEQPSGYSSDAYWQGLLQEYRAMVPNQTLQLSHEKSFTNDFHGEATFKIISWQDQGEQYSQIIGLIIGKRYAYWIIVQPWDESNLEEISNEALRLMQSAEIL